MATADGGVASPRDQSTRRLDAQLQQNVEETGVPGVSAAIVFPDGRLWSGAAGRAVLEPARRMTTQTSLPFASITKLATAALALRLVEHGRLGLDSQGDDELWGHGGEMVGGTSELWHLPARDVTIAIAWNDDLFGREGSTVPALLRIAIP